VGADAEADVDAGCVSTTGSSNRDSSGNCKAATEFGVCEGNQFEVDCVCSPNEVGSCSCHENGSETATVSYDCKSCDAVGASWAACNFP
jgi:hypothetical protein